MRPDAPGHRGDERVVGVEDRPAILRRRSGDRRLHLGKLGQGVSAAFTTGARTGAATDASCTIAEPGRDGGGDASDTDGSADGGADGPAGDGD